MTIALALATLAVIVWAVLDLKLRNRKPTLHAKAHASLASMEKTLTDHGFIITVDIQNGAK